MHKNKNIYLLNIGIDYKLELTYNIFIKKKILDKKNI